MNEKKLEYILVQNFKCKKCGCTHYDKIMYTGDKTLDEEDSILLERYVCRNCDFSFNINDYKKQDSYSMSSKELINNSIFINENKKEN